MDASQDNVASGAWTGTLDADAVAARLARARRLLVVSHAKPDGDAAGSALALARCAIATGAQAEAVFVGPAPRWLSALADGVPHRVLPPGSPAPVDPDHYDTVAVVDTGSWTQIAEMRPIIEQSRGRVVVIDHHLHGDAEVSNDRFIEPTAPAAALLVARVAVRMLGLSGASALPRPIAENIYVGLATDTGWFRFANVNPEAMHLAADLLQAGSDHAALYRLIEQQGSASRLTLMARALATLELHAQGRLAVMTLRADDFTQTGADPNDSGGFVDAPLSVAGVLVSALVTESASPATGEPIAKVSLRGKPGPERINVADVARRLGGGGHALAAGVKVPGNVDDVRRQIINAVLA